MLKNRIWYSVGKSFGKNKRNVRLTKIYFLSAMPWHYVDFRKNDSEMQFMSVIWGLIEP